MESFCWNCKNPSHHARECTLPPNPEVKKEIRQAYREGIGREREIAKTDAWMATLRMRENRILKDPPFFILKQEVSRLCQFYYDKGNLLNELMAAKITVSVDSLRSYRDAVNELVSALDGERENVREICAFKYRYKWQTNPLMEESIVSTQIEYVYEENIRITLEATRVQRNVKSAVMVVSDLDIKENILAEFVRKGLEAFSGRPLLVSAIRDQWTEMEDLLFSLRQNVKKYAYLFPENSQDDLFRKLESLQSTWTTLANARQRFDNELPKITCKVCFENDVEFALTRCGHVFCGPCLDRLSTCPRCRSDNTEVVALYF